MSQDTSRHLVFETAFADIAVDIQKGNKLGHFDLVGALLLKDHSMDPAFRARLTGLEETFTTQSIDNLGKFSFPDLPPGVYNVVISNDESSILIMLPELGKVS